MEPQDFSTVTVAHKAPGLFGGEPAGPTVVWLRGEHDISNASRLSQVIAETIAIDSEDVILDLSAVEFMSGGTIAIFLRASAFLTSRSRALILRSPRPYAVRILGLCGLGNLIEPNPADSVRTTVGSDALRTWVAVPAVAQQRAVVSAPTAGDLVDASAEPAPLTLELPLDAK